MVDRFIHIAPGYDPAVWASWAGQQETMHQSVVDYALAHPQEVDMGEPGFPLALASRIKATPRAWANLGFLIDDETPEDMRVVLANGMIGRVKAQSYLSYWSDWQQGHRPLSFEQIVDRSYEEIIPSWGNGPEVEGMIEASNERIIAALMGQPADSGMATIVSRYLAMLPPHLAERFFDSGARAIPAWLDLLRDKLAQWRAQMPGGHAGDQGGGY